MTETLKLPQFDTFKDYLDPELREKLERYERGKRARLTTIALFFPPLALLLVGEVGRACTNLLCLWPLGLLPGILHAAAVINQMDMTVSVSVSDEEIEKIQAAIQRAKYGIRSKQRTIPTALREAVLKRDDYICRYCGRRSQTMEVDHIIPVRKGGKATMDNLATACRHCNRKKGGRTPTEARMKLLSPRTRRK
jgi:uncharacterized membrane protein YqaE (UPF0057 family)